MAVFCYTVALTAPTKAETLVFRLRAAQKLRAVLHSAELRLHAVLYSAESLIQYLRLSLRIRNQRQKLPI
jgi:hypothetical protein